MDYSKLSSIIGDLYIKLLLKDEENTANMVDKDRQIKTLEIQIEELKSRLFVNAK